MKIDLGSPDDQREAVAAGRSRQLAADQQAVARPAPSLLPAVGDVDDQPIADLRTRWLDLHENNAWMLRSLVA